MEACGSACFFGFLLSCFFSVVPISLNVPFLSVEGRSVKLRIDFKNSGIFTILVLLLLQCINIQQIYKGIIGNSILEPYSILLLFLSLAYISISLDQTGFFATVAYFFAKRIGTSGIKFFIFTFILSSILTIFTSNDIVIMTITPVICFIANQSKVDVTSYLIAQYFCANIWSAGFYFGNPTNVIVAQSVHMNFIQYSFINLLPTIAAGLSVILLISVVTKNKIPEQIHVDFNDLPSLYRFQAGFGIFLLFCSTCCIIVFTFYPKVPIFLAVFPFAIIALFKDILCDFHNYLSNYSVFWNSNNNTNQMIELVTISNEETEEEAKEDSEVQLRENLEDPLCFTWNTIKILERMPWDVIPFTLGMFILVEGLDSNGLISMIAEIFSNLIGNNLFIAVFFIGFLSALSCNIMNNQPMTILFVRIILCDNFVNHNDDIVVSACLFAIALGSNFGANLTLIGALAGILWNNILSKYNLQMSYLSFASYGFKVMPICLTVSFAALALELVLFTDVFGFTVRSATTNNN